MEEAIRCLSKYKPPSPSVEIGTPSLLAANDSHLFILCKDNIIRFCSFLSPSPRVHEVRYEDASKDFASPYGSCSIPKTMSIKSLEFNSYGDALLVWGEYYVAVLKLRNPLAEDKDKVFQLLDLSEYPVDKKLMNIVSVKWNLLSSGGAITILAAGEGKSSVLITSLNHEHPVQEVSLTPSVGSDAGDMPVDICHGGDAGWNRFAVWVLRSSGDIMVLCPLVPHDCIIPKQSVTALLGDVHQHTCELERAVESMAEEVEEGPAAHHCLMLNQELQRRRVQQRWLFDVFGVGVQDRDSDEEDDEDEDGCVRAKLHDSGAKALSWVKLPRSNRMRSWKVAIQDKVSSIQSSLGGETVSPACTIACVTAAGPLQGFLGALAGSEVLVRARKVAPASLAQHSSLTIDLLLVGGGVQPVWCSSEEADDAVCVSNADATVMESLEMVLGAALSTPFSAANGSGAVNPMQGDAVNLVLDPLQPWTFHVATSYRLACITVQWGRQLEERGDALLREWSQRCEELTDQANEGDTDREQCQRAFQEVLCDLGAQKSGSISKVIDVLCLLPGGGTGERHPDEGGQVHSKGVVGVALTRSPVVGHLLLGRLDSGAVEVVNLTARQQQAEVDVRAAQRKAKLRRKSLEIEAAGGPLQPFEDIVLDLEDAMLGDLNKGSYQLGASATARLKDADEELVKLLLKEKERLEGGLVLKIEKLHQRTLQRVELLKEVQGYQKQQLQRISGTLDELDKNQESLTKHREDLVEGSANLRQRASAVLEAAQRLQPRLTHAQEAYKAELLRWQAQAARWEDKMSQLQRTASDFTGGAGEQVQLADVRLSADQEEMIGQMLAAQQARIAKSMARLSEAEAVVAGLNV
ncbi:unnamed protein product [Chrysoparadoxa australica]